MSKNLLKMTGACLALTGAAVLPLHASAQEANAVVARDAVTGQMRAANADEIAKLDAVKAEKARMFRADRKQLMGRMHKSGGHGARMTDESMSASVAVIGKDGKLQQECFDSAAEAEAALASGTLTHTHANLKPVLE
ncbi:MAG: post-PEP-CTERM-1 domain-containing protein [Massilia sp.]